MTDSQIQSVTAILLDGATLRGPDGEAMATFVDGAWYTPEGTIIEALAFDVPVVRPVITPRARREGDDAWLAAALEDVHALCIARETFTTDDVWVALSMPPREGRQLGGLMRRAAGEKWCAPTEETVPSGRGLNHRRPVRVWRSLLV